MGKEWESNLPHFNTANKENEKAERKKYNGRIKGLTNKWIRKKGKGYCGLMFRTCGPEIWVCKYSLSEEKVSDVETSEYRVFRDR